MKNQKEGLPQHLFNYVSTITPMINVDIFVYSETDKTFPLIWRDDGLYGPGWHIPGGIIRFKESAKDRLKQTIINELELDPPRYYYLIEANEITNNTRDLRGHFISLLYAAKLSDHKQKAKGTHEILRKNGEVCWFKEIPDNIIIQHRRYINSMSAILQNKKVIDIEFGGNLCWMD